MLEEKHIQFTVLRIRESRALVKVPGASPAVSNAGIRQTQLRAFLLIGRGPSGKIMQAGESIGPARLLRKEHC